MKLSELKPCAKCSGPVAPIWQVIRISIAMLGREASAVLGMTQMLGGSLALAEAMSPSSNAVVIASEEEPSLLTTLHICQTCYLSGPIDLAMLVESVGRETGGAE